MSYYSDPPNLVKEKNTRRFVSSTLKTPLSNTNGTTEESLAHSTLNTAREDFTTFQADFRGSNTLPAPHSCGYDDTTLVDSSTTLYGHTPGYTRERELDSNSSFSEHNNLGIRNAHLSNYQCTQYSTRLRSEDGDEGEGLGVDGITGVPKSSSSRRDSRVKSTSISVASTSASASPLFSSLAPIQPAMQTVTSDSSFETSETALGSIPSPQHASSDPRSAALQAVHVYGVNEVSIMVGIVKTTRKNTLFLVIRLGMQLFLSFFFIFFSRFLFFEHYSLHFFRVLVFLLTRCHAMIFTVS